MQRQNTIEMLENASGDDFDESIHLELRNPKIHMERAKFYYIEPITIKESPGLNKYKCRQLQRTTSNMILTKSRFVPKTPEMSKKIKLGGREEFFKNYLLVEVIQKLPTIKIVKTLHKSSGCFCTVKFVPKKGHIIKPINQINSYGIMQNREKIVELYEIYTTNLENIFVYDFYQWDLYEFAKTLPQPLRESTLRKIARKACEAIQTVHAQGLVHRDIKGQSFVVETVGDDFKLLLRDLAVACEAPEGQLLGKFIGSPNYVAPEVLEQRYGRECDVWSCGVMLFKLVSGSYPFRSCEKYENAYESICQSPLKMQGLAWENVSSDCIDFIKNMLLKDPRQRITLSECLNHKWLTK